MVLVTGRGRDRQEPALPGVSGAPSFRAVGPGDTWVTSDRALCPKSQTPLCQQGAERVRVHRAAPVPSSRLEEPGLAPVSPQGHQGRARWWHREPGSVPWAELPVPCAPCPPCPLSLTALTWRMAPPGGACWTPRPARARGWSCREPSRTASAASPSSTAPTATTTCPQKPCPATPPSPATCECPPAHIPCHPLPSPSLTLPVLPQAWRRHDRHTLCPGGCHRCALPRRGHGLRPSSGVGVPGSVPPIPAPLSPPQVLASLRTVRSNLTHLQDRAGIK